MTSLAQVTTIEQKSQIDDCPEKIDNTTHAVSQNTNKQDWATCGNVEGKFHYIIVADSHGRSQGQKDVFIKMFSNINWEEYLQDPNWELILSRECENVEGIGNTTLIGTTFTCVKIHKGYFEISWIGDSSSKIISYGTDKDPLKSKVIWKTKDHDARNHEDISALEQYYTPKTFGVGGSKFEKKFAWDIQATNPTIMKNIKSFKFAISCQDMTGIKDGTNMTRCLGHGGSYSRPMGFQRETIQRNTNEQYKIISATDGYWQVMCEEDNKTINAGLENGASELCQIARDRWNQEWAYIPPNSSERQDNIKIPKWNHDDIGVAVWDNFGN